MATPLPGPLKSADISRFAVRAKELEKFKPVIAYWCNYYIVNQILNKGLHTESDECMTFTTTLMDRLEQFKTDNAENDTVHDDLAAEAYVEQFALETFNRADAAIRANKATAQTAQAFQAASTFLDLMGIWQTPLNQETAAKSKYSKFHALRIAKALRSGEDPNLSNPVQERPISPPPLSPNDPEVQKITNLQPTVEESSESSRPPSLVDQHTWAAKSPSEENSVATSSTVQPDVSPLGPPPDQGYFPPTFSSEQFVPSLPTAPSGEDVVMTTPGIGTAPIPSSPHNFYNVQPPTTNQTLASSQPQAPSNHSSQPTFVPPSQPTLTQSTFMQPPSSTQPFLAPAHQTQQPQTTFSQPQAIPGQYNRDDEAVLAAQKHAKWAISALNFEDVDTAVKELRIALRALGAS